MSTSHHNIFNWLLLLALTLIWGTSYILIKKGLLGFTPIELACLRISISFIASIPIAIAGWNKIPRGKFLPILLVGLFGSGAPAFLFALALTHTGSAVTGILNATSPLWTLIIGYYFFKVLFSWQKTTGVIIGFFGALLLIIGRVGGNFSVNAFYSFLPLVATLCYGISSNLIKENLQGERPVYISGLSMLFIGVPAFTGLCFTGAPAKIISGAAWMPFCCIVILSLFGTLIAWMMFYKLVQRTDALFAASVTYLAPIVAIGWGLLDGESLSIIQLLGMALILTGVYFTTRMK